MNRFHPGRFALPAAWVVPLLAAAAVNLSAEDKRPSPAPTPRNRPPGRAYGDKNNDRGPFELPCIFGAAQYRKGGEGGGYHDTTPGYGPFPAGHGGQAWLRNDDVEIDWAFWDRASDGSQDKTHWPPGGGGSLCTPGGGDFAAWMDTGEWLAYDIVAPVEGKYVFTLRMAYGGNKKPRLHVEIDGAKAGGDLALPDGTTNKGEFSNPWHHFVDLPTSPVPVAAGPHVLKVVCDAGAPDGLPQLHYVEVRPAKTALPAVK
jgi:hypothetical protein